MACLLAGKSGQAKWKRYVGGAHALGVWPGDIKESGSGQGKKAMVPPGKFAPTRGRVWVRRESKEDLRASDD
jgi:hypothetical protein